jgi:hypothetical protein
MRHYPLYGLTGGPQPVKANGLLENLRAFDIHKFDIHKQDME